MSKVHLKASPCDTILVAFRNRAGHCRASTLLSFMCEVPLYKDRFLMSEVPLHKDRVPQNLLSFLRR